ncbi:hypothetical protein BH11ACT2_BH11ACT2_07430 [soil metagenome]
MSRLAAVLTPADLPLAELHAARLDGELFAVDSCFAPIDEPELPRLRADAIAAVWPDRIIAEQRSAAWVYGVLPTPPVQHELCADLSARARPSNRGQARVREVVIDPSEVVRIGRLDVTSPLRTVLDLARFSETFGQIEQKVCRDLMVLGGLTIDDCRSALALRRNLPGKRQAVERLRA